MFLSSLVNSEVLTNPIAGVACREGLIPGLYRPGGRQKREHGQSQEHELFHFIYSFLVNDEVLTNPITGVTRREGLIPGLYRLSGRQKREHGQGQEHELFHCVLFLFSKR
jgi:hypothetical protein